MQIPVILSRGYSLDQLIWTDWFKRQHEDAEDTNQYYYDHLEKLNIQQQHYLHQNSSDIPVPTPKSYSAFFDAVEHLDMPFDQDLTGEEDND